MIRILIVDDEPLARRGVRVCLQHVVDATIVGESATGREAIDQIRRLHPDLVFLDVQMPGMNGFEVLANIEPEHCPLIIFLTAYDEYALQAFTVHAIDYILKPIDDDRFSVALNSARKRLKEKNADVVVGQLKALLESSQALASPSRYLERFTVKTGSRIQLIPAEEVDWIQASGDYVTIHAGKRTHLLRETLDSLERQLNPKDFVRIHRSTVVALKQVKELYSLPSRDSLVRLHDGTELRASRRYRHRLPGMPS